MGCAGLTLLMSADLVACLGASCMQQGRPPLDAPPACACIWHCIATLSNPLPMHHQCPLLAPCRPDQGDIPTLRQLGFSAATLARCAADKAAQGANVRGGESEALRQLQAFAAHMAPDASTMGGAPAAAPSCGGTTATVAASATAPPGTRFSCQISPWLAMGCLSPRQMYRQLLQRAEGSGAGAPAAGKQGGECAVMALGMLAAHVWRGYGMPHPATFTSRCSSGRGTAARTRSAARGKKVAAAFPETPGCHCN